MTKWCSQVTPDMDPTAHSVDDHPDWCPFNPSYGQAYIEVNGAEQHSPWIDTEAFACFPGDWIAWKAPGEDKNSVWQIWGKKNDGLEITLSIKRLLPGTAPFITHTKLVLQRNDPVKVQFLHRTVTRILTRDATPPRRALAVLSEGIALRNANNANTERKSGDPGGDRNCRGNDTMHCC